MQKRSIQNSFGHKIRKSLFVNRFSDFCGTFEDFWNVKKIDMDVFPKMLILKKAVF